MRHTKIVATVGPASASPEALSALIGAGVDVFRLNFSHGGHESHAEIFDRIRQAAAEADRHVAIMQDLSGPKIRTTAVAGDGPLVLTEGQEVRLAAGEAHGEAGRLFTPYAELVHSARLGDRLLLDDGRIELRVVRKAADELTTVVVHGGPLGSNKGINAPGVPLPASALTDKDVHDLRFGLELGVDLVAISFVQTAEDVRKARDEMTKAGRQVPIVAKIERPAAVENLESILDLSDAVMVARGDLGLEMPLERVPRVQKEIIRQARTRGRPVIVATQVLESMRTEPRPTRAEVSDAANAVDEGVDAIMLAGETAIGAFPVRAVQTLDAIIRDAESVPSAHAILPTLDPAGSVYGRALCEAAVTLATTGQAHAIVAMTSEGKTARLLSGLRPTAPIFAVTGSSGAASTLALFWGVVPLVSSEVDLSAIGRRLLEQKLISPGSVVVYVNVSPELDREDTNFLKLRLAG